MRRDLMKTYRSIFYALVAVTLAFAMLAGSTRVPRAGAAAATGTQLNFNPYAAGVPDINPNISTAGVRQPTGLQQDALSRFQSEAGSRANVRWNNFAGSPEILTGFHTAPSTDTPENTARAFVTQNSALFGVSADTLVLADQKQALGGYLLRFQQRAAGVDVATGGLGFLMNSDKQIRMVMGSTFRDVNVSAANPSLDGAAATASAKAALAQYASTSSTAASSAAFGELESQVAPALRAPRLNIFPTADGYRLAWNVITFSRNPFGMFVTQVDVRPAKCSHVKISFAHSCQPAPYTGGHLPEHAAVDNPDTGAYKGTQRHPDGLLRVNFEPQPRHEPDRRGRHDRRHASCSTQRFVHQTAVRAEPRSAHSTSAPTTRPSRRSPTKRTIWPNRPSISIRRISFSSSTIWSNMSTTCIVAMTLFIAR